MRWTILFFTKQNMDAIKPNLLNLSLLMAYFGVQGIKLHLRKLRDLMERFD